LGANIPDLADGLFSINVVDVNTININRSVNPGVPTYIGQGTIALVSEVNILTKQYNFFQKEGRNVHVPRIDLNVDRTDAGTIQIDYYTSTSNLDLQLESGVTGAQIATGTMETSPYDLYPYEQTQQQLWHSMYIQADGEFVQLRIYYDAQQILDPDTALVDFELNAIQFFAQPSAQWFQ
jgi:hypothetical protein